MSEPDFYPMDLSYPAEEYPNFADLKYDAEAASDCLNFPISWTLYDEQSEDWGKYLEPGAQDKKEFTLVFLMGRKSCRTWGKTTNNFDRAEVQEWLDTFIKGEVMKWYGWVEERDTLAEQS